MKFSSNKLMRILCVACLAMFSVAPAWAVFPFSWTTDANSVITGGSWTGIGEGGGTVQPNIVMGTNPGPVGIAVQDFSSGIFSVDGLDGTIYSTDGITKSGDRRLLTNPISVSHTISLTGGTADLRLHNSSSTDGGASLFNSVGLTGFSAGVTSVSWTVRFSEAIAGRSTTLASVTTRPMGAGLALLDAGGSAVGDFTVGMEYGQIYHELDGAFVAGTPATATPFVNPGFGSPAAGSTSFTSNAFNGFNQFLLVRGYDVDGGGFSALDASKVYMREMTWTITPDAGKQFKAGTIFVMSMDGEQYLNVDNVIPEPTSFLLVAGSVVGGCLLRRRRA